MLKSIKLPFSEEYIAIKPPSKNNHITVLIGENGTRKSYLLRNLLDSALSTSPQNEEDFIEFEKNFSFRPSKIITISALSNDRFPSKSIYSDPFKNQKYDVDEYTYIGPRTSRNIISRNQSIRELINSILNNPEKLITKQSYLSNISSLINITGKFKFGLNPAPGHNTDLEGYFSAIRKKNHRPINDENFAKDIASIINNPFSQELRAVLSELRFSKYWNKRTTEDSAFSVHIDFSNGTIETNGISPQALALGFKYGYLRSTSLIFLKSDHSSIDQESLSSGEWGIFSTLSSLALSVEDRTLILIDEPENGLHPAWQRNYLKFIQEAVENTKLCHTVVATHSPLILSSLPIKNSDCIELKKLGHKISASRLESPSGWDSSSILENIFILESARGPDITNLVNSALKLIATGSLKNKEKLLKIGAKLKEYQRSLPADDILIDIIDSINSVTK